MGRDEGQPVFISGAKYFVLEGDVSQESSITGVAEFTDFKIMGATEEVAYLMFYVDGIVTVWTKVFNPLSIDSLPP